MLPPGVCDGKEELFGGEVVANLCCSKCSEWRHLTESFLLVEMLGLNFKAERLVGELRFRFSFGFWVVSGEDRDCSRNISSSSSSSTHFPAMLAIFAFSIL